jgi:hypothetical protein
MDDDIDTTGTTKQGTFNPGTDTNPSYEDLAFGGAGIDVLLLNTNGDRANDWTGEFDSYFTPYAQFGADSITRTGTPALVQYLYDLSKSDGADQTLTAQYGGDPARNGEPFGELGLVKSGDAAWNDQKGQPRDPQPGNTGGAQVDLHNGNSTAGTRPIYETADVAARDTDPTQFLTNDQLAPVVAQAKALWTAALGAADERLAVLDDAQVVVGNLPDERLGVTLGHRVLIDSTAAGYGWFVNGSTASLATSGRMDLLTVVAHELGNVMGFAEDVRATDLITSPYLSAGDRYLPDGSSSILAETGSVEATPGARASANLFLAVMGESDGSARSQSLIDWNVDINALVRVSPYGAASGKTAVKPLFPGFDETMSDGASAGHHASSRRNGVNGSGEQDGELALLAPSISWDWTIEGEIGNEVTAAVTR